MEKQIHGGNIYDKEVSLDFSVNINPLGMPDGVQDAIPVSHNGSSVVPIYLFSMFPAVAPCLINTISIFLTVRLSDTALFHRLFFPHAQPS